MAAMVAMPQEGAEHLHCRPCLAADAPLEALLSGDSALCELLHARKVHTVRDLVYLPAWELRDWLLVPEEEAARVIISAWAACAAPPASALDLVAVRSRGTRAPLPLGSLGAAVGGGLSGAFMEVAGPPAVGKTQLCLHIAALTAADGGEVFWLDTEGTFAPPRLLELLQAACTSRAGGDVEQAETLALEALGRVRRKPCGTLQELHNVIAELERCGRRGNALPALVIVDSVAAVARNEGDSSESRRVSIPRRQAALSALAGLFKALVAANLQQASASSLAAAPPGVLVTNQVAGDPSGGNSRVTLGHVWHHAVNWRLVLSHLAPGDSRGFGLKENAMGNSRFLHVEKSPCSPPITIEYTIGHTGLSEVGIVGEAMSTTRVAPAGSSAGRCAVR